MGLKVHGLRVGQACTTLENTFYMGGGLSPKINRQDMLPYGYFDEPTGQGVVLSTFIWYIDGGEQKVLVDTMLDDPEKAEKISRKYGVKAGIKRPGCERESEQDIINALKKVNVTPEQIDIVILTHLHSDHCANNELFKNATFVIQRDEIPIALVPPPYAMWYYSEYSSHLTNVLDRVEAIEGDVRITKGIEVWKLGGHSPGSQAIIVDTDIGRVALAGDVAYTYKNLELRWPGGVFCDLKEVIQADNRLLREADIVIPGHDSKFLELFPDGTVG